jgi:ABC-type glycerol-3-phosphate transport system substrate-binding protein
MRLSALAVAACLATACTSSSSPSQQQSPSPSTAPASIQVLATTRADHQLDIAAKLLTAAGAFAPNVAVTFSVDVGAIAPAQNND